MQGRIIVVFLSWFLFALPSAWAVDRGVLFKVTGKGHAMYLFGTIHLGAPDFYPLEARIAGALAAAPTLALEIDPLDVPQLLLALQAHGLTDRPGGAAMPAALRARLDKVLARLRLDPKAVLQYRPWLMAATLAVAEYKNMGYSDELSVDRHLALTAGRNKTPILSLESAQLQFGLFNRLSEADQLAFLEESIAQIETGKQGEEVRLIANAWRTADRRAFDDIAERVASDTSVSGRFVKRVLLDERNVAIADKLVQLLARENNSVAAIGVLHLIGSNSVPELLGARGVNVERIY